MVHSWLASTILLSTLLLGPGPSGVQQPPAKPQQRPVDPAVKRDGWWIRLNPGSKADAITWQFSEPGKATKPVTSSWQRSTDPDNFDVPDAVRSADVLQFSVSAKPPKASASFCVFYAAHGVQLVEFSGSLERTLNLRGRDKNCTP